MGADVEFNIKNKCPFCGGTMRIFFYKIPGKDGYYVMLDCTQCEASNIVGNEYVKKPKSKDCMMKEK